MIGNLNVSNNKYTWEERENGYVYGNLFFNPNDPSLIGDPNYFSDGMLSWTSCFNDPEKLTCSIFDINFHGLEYANNNSTQNISNIEDLFNYIDLKINDELNSEEYRGKKGKTGRQGRQGAQGEMGIWNYDPSLSGASQTDKNNGISGFDIHYNVIKDNTSIIIKHNTKNKKLVLDSYGHIISFGEAYNNIGIQGEIPSDDNNLNLCTSVVITQGNKISDVSLRLSYGS